MNVEQARFNMIEQQIRPWEVLDQGVLDLLQVVKREEFVPPAFRSIAFADTEIPLGHGAVMLAPKIEAKMLQELQIKPSDKVLEIGAGSGYMAALLAAKAEHVFTVEIEPDLAEMARANLKRQGVDNVTVEEGDGARGWAAHAPYRRDRHLRLDAATSAGVSTTAQERWPPGGDRRRAAGDGGATGYA